VKEAVGFNEQRGDSVNVINASFAAPAGPAALPWWQDPLFWDQVLRFAWWLLALAVALLLFRLLRERWHAQQEIERQRQEQERAPRPEWIADHAGAAPAVERQIPTATDLEDALQLVRRTARQDPKLVAQIVRNWLEEDEPR
jgi:flagellar M-ring protein FliF